MCSGDVSCLYQRLVGGGKRTSILFACCVCVCVYGAISGEGLGGLVSRRDSGEMLLHCVKLCSSTRTRCILGNHRSPRPSKTLWHVVFVKTFFSENVGVKLPGSKYLARSGRVAGEV